jgi:hypothetical protein
MPAALKDDPLGLLRSEIAVYVGQHGGGTALGEHPRRCQPHAFGGACDQSHLPFEIVDRVHQIFTQLGSFNQHRRIGLNAIKFPRMFA